MATSLNNAEQSRTPESNGFDVFGLGSSNYLGFRYESEFCTPTSCKKMRYDDWYPYGYATGPAQPAVGVLVAVHKLVASDGEENGKVVMEYDFFRNEARNDEQQNTSVVAAKASTFADDEEISTSLAIGLPGHGPAGGFDDSLDLSLTLKLSN